MEGKGEIFASLVKFKHHLIAETTRNENEDKKTNTKALGLTNKHNRYQTSNHDIQGVSRHWTPEYFLSALFYYGPCT